MCDYILDGMHGTAPTTSTRLFTKTPKRQTAQVKRHAWPHWNGDINVMEEPASFDARDLPAKAIHFQPGGRHGVERHLERESAKEETQAQLVVGLYSCWLSRYGDV